jgi:hypothetical protein
VATAGSQVTGDSTGAAQAGPVDVDAPVRVRSDGGDTGSGTAGGAPQTTGDSTGTAQVGSADADAPVRVLSDGGDTGSATADGAPQTAGDTTGAAQVGSADVAAPVRVLSDGGDARSGPATSSAGQTAIGTDGALQVGAPSVFAPARVLSEGSNAAGVPPGDGEPTPGTPELTVPGSPEPNPPLVGDEGDGSAPDGGSGDLRRLVDGGGDTGPGTQPALDFESNGEGDEAGVAEVATLGAADPALPVTGLGFIAVVILGLWLLGSGLALRLVPGGKRR